MMQFFLTPEPEYLRTMCATNAFFSSPFGFSVFNTTSHGIQDKMVSFTRHNFSERISCRHKVIALQGK